MGTSKLLGFAARRRDRLVRVLGIALALFGQALTGGSSALSAPRELRSREIGKATLAAKQSCVQDADCADHTICTTDRCQAGTCVHDALPGCIACDPLGDCPPLDVVFILDTSGSMGDEAAALCNQMAAVVSELAADGITVRPYYLGITETPGGPFSCLTGNVVSLLGSTVPGTLSTCPFPGSLSAFESWGPATAIVAERFSWNQGTTRVIIPISDEGPCNGDLPEGCNDPGDDRDAVENAVAVANAAGVIVSPITGTGASSCVRQLASALALGTGGMSFDSLNPAADLADAVANGLRQLCDDASTCDDGELCTVDDRCDLSGRCEGTSLEKIECDGDEDCFGSPCDLTLGVCACVEEPELCLETVGGQADGSCFVEEDEVRVNVVIERNSHLISGVQFQIQYDPALLEFLSVQPGVVYDPTSPFTMSVGKIINATEGKVFFAVVTSFGHPGTHGPAVMATMRFRAIAGCATTDICYFDENPRVTILSDSDGDSIPFVRCCTGDITLSKGPPILQCPADVALDVEAGSLSRMVTWAPVQSVDGCEGVAQPTCTAINSHGLAMDALARTGGLFPAGTTKFSCTSSNSCGLQDACTWTVDVAETSPFKVDVQLAPPMAAGPIDRCIEFEFYSSCVESPVVVSHTLRFGRPFHLPGFARNVTLDVPAGDYACVTARDPLHTLRSVANLSIESGAYVARFTGDPSLMGNWLIGGNLNGDHVVDALDHASLLTVWMPPDALVVDPDSACGTPGPHGDINGDGLVDTFDAELIDRALLVEDEASCCGGDVGPPGRLSIPVSLLQPGLGLRLKDADFNRDGFLDVDEMALVVEQGLGALVKRAARPSHASNP